MVALYLRIARLGELCPVITDNAGRLAIEPDKRIQFPRHPCAREAGVSHQAEVLATAIVIHGQDARPAGHPNVPDRKSSD